MSGDKSFHAGERAVQQWAGETAIAERNIGMVSDTVIGGARHFIAQQFMLALASIDGAGNLWASLLFGKPGFVHADDGSAVMIDVPLKERDLADPLWDNISGQPDLGMLFIELGSRRRYRVNGSLQRADADGLEVVIREAYPNCPKYIQRRHLRQRSAGRPAQAASEGQLLDGTVAAIIAQADTIFVASRHAASGADVSHRGGAPGFARIIDRQTLCIPDFKGNSMFNTLGNFEVDPHAGLCIPDFIHGKLLQLTGTAVIRWDQDDPHNETAGTRRYWEFTVIRWRLRDTPQQLEWEYLDASPFNPVITSIAPQASA
ncbi:pyridoxamine 5'-phosphate oxidase family protein [Janthinobacterium sp. Mn2066]|uniref:pyridoxamine 5'-phosphate oxidase family protein n=1 Tax=Janthinobacterium sp. Mn2066 TaxID=3395264 RepID=UPI003BD91F5C